MSSRSFINQTGRLFAIRSVIMQRPLGAVVRLSMQFQQSFEVQADQVLGTAAADPGVRAALVVNMRMWCATRMIASNECFAKIMPSCIGTTSTFELSIAIVTLLSL
jgi:hypothetical protein